MKLARVLLIAATAAGLAAQTPTWDASGNGMLNGTYYFRHVIYQLSNAGNGTLYDTISLYGTVNFTGTGTYSMSATEVDVQAQQLGSSTATGTYSIAASGHGFLSSPLYKGDFIYGLVNAQGVFVGSSTENLNGYNDVFIAAPLSSPAPTASTFKGTYSLAYIDLSGDYANYTVGAMLSMNPDGVSNVGTVGVVAYEGQYGSAKSVQSLPGVKFRFSNGAAVVTFPNSSSALFAGDYYLYFSPDGNFVFGGSPYSSDLLVGVRTGTAAPNLSGKYYEAGLDQDESALLTTGYADMDSFYGSFDAVGGGNIVGHQRLLDFFNPSTADFTYSDTYNVAANGTYSSPFTNYVVGNGVRIGSGIGPYLGLSVALQAPAMNPSLSSSGVFLNPQGVVNAGSSAPFTASLAPGELLTLYGANLASETQVASAAPFPFTLGGVQVTVNGIPAPIYYVTPGQMSAIVPYGVTGGIAKVQVFNNNVASNAVTARISKTAPGVLTRTANGLGYGDVTHLDGSFVNAGSPAQSGETLAVYLTGLGAVSPTIQDGAAGPSNPLANTTNTITAYIGGVSAPVAYAGLAPNLPGLYQINLTLPTGLTAGDNVLDIAGPDAYSGECLVAISGATSASAAAAATPFRAVPHALRSRGPGATGPTPR